MSQGIRIRNTCLTLNWILKNFLESRVEVIYKGVSQACSAATSITSTPLPSHICHAEGIERGKNEKFLSITGGLRILKILTCFRRFEEISFMGKIVLHIRLNQGLETPKNQSEFKHFQVLKICTFNHI